jgi:hypothetical protein
MTFLALLVVPVAWCGDVWIEVASRSEGTAVALDVPAAWLLEDGEPVEILVEGEPVDLRSVARDVAGRNPGARQVVVGLSAEGDPVRAVLTHRRRPVLGASEGLVLDLTGPEGGTFHVDLSLADGGGPIALALAGTEIHGEAILEGIALPWQAGGFLDAIRAQRPQLLAEVRGDRGGALAVRSR